MAPEPDADPPGFGEAAHDMRKPKGPRPELESSVICKRIAAREERPVPFGVVLPKIKTRMKRRRC